MLNLKYDELFGTHKETMVVTVAVVATLIIIWILIRYIYARTSLELYLKKNGNRHWNLVNIKLCIKKYL